MKNIHDFFNKKQKGEKITMVTSYDYWSAKIVGNTEIDCILVGDSLAMVMHGHNSTINADVETMQLHTQAVVKGANDKFVIGDMPFLSYRKGTSAAMESVDALLKAGAAAVKLEGVYGHEKVIEFVVQSGVPVMGHIGLTPQSIHQLGGFRVQGKSETAATDLLKQAQILEDLGCFSIVLECVPANLAQEITAKLTIPTIGIGAGPFTDGQVLVFQDLLGLNIGFKPKFLKRYLNGYELVETALGDFVAEVKNGAFPTMKESYK